MVGRPVVCRAPRVESQGRRTVHTGVFLRDTAAAVPAGRARTFAGSLQTPRASARAPPGVESADGTGRPPCRLRQQAFEPVSFGAPDGRRPRAIWPAESGSPNSTEYTPRVKLFCSSRRWKGPTFHGDGQISRRDLDRPPEQRHGRLRLLPRAAGRLPGRLLHGCGGAAWHVAGTRCCRSRLGR